MLDDFKTKLHYFLQLSTVLFTLMYFITPFFGVSESVSHSWYQRIFISSAASFALRLNQRIVSMEDSFHYLMFSILFLLAGTARIAMCPVFLFALRGANNYTLKLLNKEPRSDQEGSSYNGPKFLLKIQSKDTDILHIIALNELMLMPVSVIVALTSSGLIFLPFLYLQFLKLRYKSVRNAYCRQSCSQLRMLAQNVSTNSSYPSFVRSLFTVALTLGDKFGNYLAQ